MPSVPLCPDPNQAKLCPVFGVAGGPHVVARPPNGRRDQRPVWAREEELAAGAHRLHLRPHRDITRAGHRVRTGSGGRGEIKNPPTVFPRLFCQPLIWKVNFCQMMALKTYDHMIHCCLKTSSYMINHCCTVLWLFSISNWQQKVKTGANGELLI